MSRLPIRARLTLPFAVGMAVMLAGAGLFIYSREGGALLSSVDQSLRGQSQEAAGRVEHGRSLLDRDSAAGPMVAQLVNRHGEVVQSSPTTLGPILDAQDLHAVLAGRTVWRSALIGGLQNDWRILAVPNGSGAVLIAQSLEPREEALHRLVREFLLWGPAVLLLAILAGYGVAVAALRPVEAMRRRAAAIGATTPEKRLPVPAGRDELSRLAETLNEMLGRLQSALEHERRFVDDASHELRTPLALLKAELEIALRQPRSHAELEDALRSAADETDRLTRLAEDLLLVARADGGGLPVRLERVSARQMLVDVAARFEVRGAVVVAEGSDAELDADSMRLEQALGNLVDNALSHGEGQVVLSVASVGETVELHVTDDGPGFPPGFVDRAFDRFSRADEARGHGGTGLGLAIVELIARAHGGTASVATRPGGGADAWISLPAAGAPVEPPVALTANS